jgi:hypothetical protein
VRQRLLEGMSPQQSGHCDERCPMRTSGSPTVFAVDTVLVVKLHLVFFRSG